MTWGSDLNSFGIDGTAHNETPFTLSSASGEGLVWDGGTLWRRTATGAIEGID